MAYNLEKRWKKLYDSSLIRAESLEPIKKKFADVTTIEIRKFCASVIFIVLVYIGEREKKMEQTVYVLPGKRFFSFFL